jgi:hypothetical protein
MSILKQTKVLNPYEGVPRKYETSLKGLRSVVADLSSSEGTMVDDSAVSLNLSSKIMVALLGDEVVCTVCKREVHLFFMTLPDLDRHLGQHHTDARIQWACLYCGRSFPKYHGTKYHIPKCDGTSRRYEGACKCEACPMSFGPPKY